MATLQQMLDAAKIQPRYRTVAEQSLVDKGKGEQSVRNADHDAKEAQRIGR